MIELSEAVVIAGQINATVAGARIARAVASAFPRFAWSMGWGSRTRCCWGIWQVPSCRSSFTASGSAVMRRHDER